MCRAMPHNHLVGASYILSAGKPKDVLSYKARVTEGWKYFFIHKRSIDNAKFSYI